MDALLLHALSEKRRLSTLKHAVPEGMMSPETMAMLAWFAAYFHAFPERECVDVDELRSLISLRSGSATKEQIAVTLHLAEQLRNKPDATATNGILGQLHELDFAGRAAALIAKYQNGEEVELSYELNKLASATVRSKASATPTDYIRTDINDILSEVANDQGLKFDFIQALNSHILGLSGGASIAIAARPDKGKTSFIAKALTRFAPQVVRMYGDKRPILWGNNEGSGKRIIPRIYQAALGMDLHEIIALSNKNELVPAYVKAIGGVQDLIRVKDIHGASLAHVEQILEEQNPSVMVLDMIANVRLGGPQNGANKADGVEQAWQEWREMLVRHDCIGLATVQISAEGGNMLYPPYSAMKDSKTGIQGATDVIIMMGSLDNPDAQTIRGLSSPKNKFAVPGKPSCFQAEVYFDGSKCTFDDGSGTTAGPAAVPPAPKV